MPAIKFIGDFSTRDGKLHIEIPKKLRSEIPKTKYDKIITVFWEDAIKQD